MTFEEYVEIRSRRERGEAIPVTIAEVEVDIRRVTERISVNQNLLNRYIAVRDDLIKAGAE